MYKAFLIKYGEIGVKGKNRYLFEDALVRQIRYALKEVDGEFNVTKENGRIYATAVDGIAIMLLPPLERAAPLTKST